jgi:steroid 5-alpha reductase family enzyme
LALCLVVVAVFLSAAMAFAWFVAIRTGKSGFVDATWSFAVGIASIAAALWPFDSGDYSWRRWLVAGFAAVWSARLGAYIFTRSLSHGDDPRYAALKAEWGDKAPARLFQFLQVQAVAGWPLVGAVLLAAHAPFPEFRVQDGVAVIVFAAAFAGETIADRQMAQFRRDPKNRGGVCDAGLWGWSRHPNYFFEWLGWCAYTVAAVDFTGAYPWGWMSLAAPAVMYALLVHISGVPPLEAYMKRSRPQAFADYQRRVSAFWPLPPALRDARRKARAS